MKGCHAVRGADAALEDGTGEGDSKVHATVLAVVREYLAVAAGGQLPGDFSSATPLMEAGLDSLDLLKAGNLLMERM